MTARCSRESLRTQHDGSVLVTAVPSDTWHEDGRASPAAQRTRDDVRETELSLQDPARFGEIFDLYFAEIHRYVASRLGRDAADDIAAETFLTAFRKRRRFDPAQGMVRSWLYGIATNHMSHYRRREVREYRAMARIVVLTLDEGHADRVADRVSADAARSRLASALAELPQRDREVLLLVALAGLSHAEVAAALGIPYGTVGSRLNRVRRKLRGALADINPVFKEDQDHG
jgi:RNA polymerase sigma factor (sigma-70 family)